jgi:hypothetical protein
MWALVVLLACVAPQPTAALQRRALLQPSMRGFLKDAGSAAAPMAQSLSDTASAVTTPDAPADAPLPASTRVARVRTIEQLQNATNHDGVRHIVIEDHLTSQVRNASEALLQPTNGTLVIRVRFSQAPSSGRACLLACLAACLSVGWSTAAFVSSM